MLSERGNKAGGEERVLKSGSTMWSSGSDPWLHMALMPWNASCSPGPAGSSKAAEPCGARSLQLWNAVCSPESPADPRLHLALPLWNAAESTESAGDYLSPPLVPCSPQRFHIWSVARALGTLLAVPLHQRVRGKCTVCCIPLFGPGA